MTPGSNDTHPNMLSLSELGEPVIAIFDIGKTNKKLFLYNRHYNIVFEKATRFAETVDEDGDPCENLEQLSLWTLDAFQSVLHNPKFTIKAINFSTYGASFVHLNKHGQPVAPLYNYLKSFPADLLRQFYKIYGGEEAFSNTTASPVLGHLNSGMQLYWLKHCKPDVFKKIQHSLHLPQYMSFLFSGKYYSDITSIGCHTNLWDFSKQQYHDWVKQEGIIEKLAPIVPSTLTVNSAIRVENYQIGVGLHDSSAALIPYMVTFKKPFVLISTGTWCISLNPFNNTALTADELKHDCLAYLSYEGRPVKASRIFAGNEHEVEVKRIGEFFSKNDGWYRSVLYDEKIIGRLKVEVKEDDVSADVVKQSQFVQRDLASFKNEIAAYHQLIADIVDQQKFSTHLVLKGTPVKKIYVDGGFSNNVIYMKLLAKAFPELEIFSATVAQATALGAALAIHNSWNDLPVAENLVEMKPYSFRSGEEELQNNNP